MATMEEVPADAEAWALTLDEYQATLQARETPDDSVFAVNLSQETPGSLERFKIVELSALALVMGARRSGKKSVIISSIIHRYQAREAGETVESLSSRKVVEIDALLSSAGLPTSYENKATKARLLISWRDNLMSQANVLLARATHELKVRDAIADRRYHRAIAAGQMTVERAAAIITRAGLAVPASLTSVPASFPVRRKGGRATRALEDGEIRAMFASIDGRYAERTRAMLMCGIHLALRASELCGLTVGDVFDRRNVRTYIPIRPEIAKGSKGRSIRMGDEVRRVMGEFLARKAAPFRESSTCGESLDAPAPLFVSQKGGHLSRKQLFATVKDLLQRAGIDQSPHCLRKTGATIYYEQSGYDLIATQVFLGHTDPSVTRRYIGITPTQTVEYAQRSSQALISAVLTGQSEVLSRSDDDHQRLLAELERRGQTIDTLTAQVDRLTRLLEGEDAAIAVEGLAGGGGKVVSIFGLYSGDGAKGSENPHELGQVKVQISFSQREPFLVRFAVEQFRRLFPGAIHFVFSLGEDRAYFMDGAGLQSGSRLKRENSLIRL